MPKITFLQPDGAGQTVDAAVGRSLMQAAVENFVPGILGDCGGACSCATCHAYVDVSWQARLPTKTGDEAFMLDGALDVRDNSRLCCQLPSPSGRRCPKGG